METKEIITALKEFCEDVISGKSFPVNILLFKEAADRLEELEKKNAKIKAENEARKLFCEAKDEINKDLRRSLISMERQLSEKQSEWISVEDERKPDEGETCIVMTSVDCIYNVKYSKDGFPNAHRIRYWMHKPALPKPPKSKEPTFRDVFLKAFPKAVVLEHSGVPRVCAKEVFPQLGDDESPCDMRCAVCWSQPYFEEEEEGEADA